MMQPLDLVAIESIVPSALRAFFKEHSRVALAYSGGCDSVFLLACARACGVEVHPFTIDTAFQYDFEADDACLAAAQLGSATETIELDIFEHPEVIMNTSDRCYHCKRVIFQALFDAARKIGIDVVIDGTNATDDPARRPGFRAIEEFGVRSPLRDAGLTKDQIRDLSRKMGLLTADKPNYSCLATRVEVGQQITPELLESFVQEDWLDRENGAHRDTL